MKKLALLILPMYLLSSEQWQEDLNTLVQLDMFFHKSYSSPRAEIKKRFKDDNFQRQTFLRYESLINEILNTPLSNKKRHIELEQEKLNLITCRDYVLLRNGKDEQAINKEKERIKRRILNTKEKKNRYIKHLEIFFQNKDIKDVLKINMSEKEKCLARYKKSLEMDK